MKRKFSIHGRLIASVAALTLVSNVAKSQISNPIHVGLKGGTNFTDLSISSAGISSKNALGYSAGAFVRVDISRFYIQGELLYAKKVSKLEYNKGVSQKAKWNNIDAPLLIGYKIIQSEKLNLRLFGGGVYSYVLNDDASLLKEASKSFKRFDRSNIGYQAGAGVDLGRLTFDLRYEGGLSNVSKEFKSRPNSFQASVGLMIF